MNSNDFIVIDDIIPLSYQEEIKNTLFGVDFPWFFNADLTYGTNYDGPTVEKTPGNFHVFKQNCMVNSHFYNLVSPLSHIAMSAFGKKYNDVTFCRTFLQFPLNVKIDHTPLHVDVPHPHTVVLYYVNDSDSETIIVDKVHDGSEFAEFGCQVKDYNILKSVKPKQGRAIVFNGKYYHAHQIVKSGVRCAINFNII